MLNLLLGLLELVGELLVCASQVFHCLRLVVRGLAVRGSSGGYIVESFCGGSSVGVVCVRTGRGNSSAAFDFLFHK